MNGLKLPEVGPAAVSGVAGCIQRRGLRVAA